MAEGILDTEVARKASEQLGDLEYSLPLMQQLENNPLFKVGFDPEHIYYQKEGPYRDLKTTVPGTYYGSSFDKEKFEEKLALRQEKTNNDADDIRSHKYKEIIKNREKIPSEFVFMGGPTKELNEKNISTTVHEVIHRSIETNPEYIDWYNENNLWKDEREHGMISYMIGLQFPELKDKEYERANWAYDIDLNNKETEEEFKKLYNEATQISQNILDKRLEEGRAKEPVVPIKAEETEKSWFQKLREKIGFNEGGMVDINYLTRRL